MKEYIMIYRQNEDGSTTPVFMPIQGMAVSDGQYNLLMTPIIQPKTELPFDDVIKADDLPPPESA